MKSNDRSSDINERPSSFHLFDAYYKASYEKNYPLFSTNEDYLMLLPFINRRKKS